jgi:hypothetical protein
VAADVGEGPPDVDPAAVHLVLAIAAARDNDREQAHSHLDQCVRSPIVSARIATTSAPSSAPPTSSCTPSASPSIWEMQG